ncbi:MAG: hypothetical protein JSS69_01310 [Acidobacteria bacterium]|nr:hypothetical protein [Acidobacteriota bacterium]MBS1864531.1 hypothetical protein [Acidobacteriota bacterium]
MASPVFSPQPADFRELLSSSARYWEPRRILYNLILFAVCLIWLAASWPHFRPALHLANLFPMVFLALIANVCYCAAYMVDLPLSSSTVRSSWLSCRWALWLVGMIFALLLENYWIADEIYPYVN